MRQLGLWEDGLSSHRDLCLGPHSAAHLGRSSNLSGIYKRLYSDRVVLE